MGSLTQPAPAFLLAANTENHKCLETVTTETDNQEKDDNSKEGHRCSCNSAGLKRESFSVLKLFRKQWEASELVAKISRGPGPDPPLPASWLRCAPEVLEGLRLAAREWPAASPVAQGGRQLVPVCLLIKS